MRGWPPPPLGDGCSVFLPVSWLPFLPIKIDKKQAGSLVSARTGSASRVSNGTKSACWLKSANLSHTTPTNIYWSCWHHLDHGQMLHTGGCVQTLACCASEPQTPPPVPSGRTPRSCAVRQQQHDQIRGHLGTALKTLNITANSGNNSTSVRLHRALLAATRRRNADTNHLCK